MTGGEFSHREIDESNSLSEVSYKDIKPEKQMTSKELNDAVRTEFDNASEKTDNQDVKDNKEAKGLSEEERNLIKEETGWSDEIIDHIDNMDQYKIYKDAGLHEEVIDGRKCLVKEIDYDYEDPKTGKTNRELMDEGRSPIDSKTGEKIELHHMGQGYDAPFAELCEKSEHGDGNHSVLHDNNVVSWRNDSKLDYQYKNVDKPNHWIERSKEV